jgi:mortality factor 4-like protein 1
LILIKNKNIIFNPKFTIHFPESLKEWLIDDFDFVIQQNKVNKQDINYYHHNLPNSNFNQILRLPSRKSVSSILKEYLKMKQNEDSVKNEYSSRLNETINGLIRYFNSMLGSQLLYKFERVQYTDVCYYFF